MKRTWLLCMVGICGCAVSPAVMAAQDAPWLGCRIGPTPKALDAQLMLGGGGAMVLNVAKESPADKAGLERYDVIVKLGKEAVKTPEQLIDMIQKHEVGEKIDLGIVHQAKEKTVAVTLAARPEPGTETYKYERLPDVMFDDHVDVFGRLLRRGPHGWEMEDLGKLKDIPPSLRPALPRFDDQRGRYWSNKGEETPHKFQARVTHDGMVITLDGTIGGKVTVRRSNDKGEATTVYETPEELKKGDPEAYRIYVDATGGAKAPKPEAKTPRASAEPGESMGPYRKQIQEWLDKLPALDRERIGELLRQQGKEWAPELDAAKKQIAEMQKQIEQYAERLRDWSRGGPNEAKNPSQLQPAPTTRFEMAPDGKIIVHVRQGDSELTLNFDNAQQLKAKRPDLYQRFEALQKQK
jgi:hypothetical protein